MNHREEPHLPADARRALYALALLLIPALGLEQGHAGPRQGLLFPRAAEPTPYLPVIGFPALRFAEAPPPPDLVTRPALAGPPVPTPPLTEPATTTTNVTAAQGVPVAKQDSTTAPESTSRNSEPAPAARSLAPILPDTARPVVHAEDFLPYFEVPGSVHQPADVILGVPAVPPTTASSPVPPSSATYTQTPR